MKIMVKILFFIPMLYLAVMPVFFSRIAGTYTVKGVSIDIADSSDYHFITKRNLLNLVNRTGRIIGKPVSEIPVAEIEGRVKELHELRAAEVYIGVDGTMHVYADQRDPVMRLVPSSGGDFFIDEEGVVVRKRNLYNPRLHVITGNVTVTQAMLNGVSVHDTSIKHTILRDIFHLVNYIRSDAFWSAQIDQVHVDGNDEIDLIPRVGNHVIHIGTIENLDGKLRNLETFYEKVLPEVGWNKYSVINLEYRDQIVCRKRNQQ